MKHKQRDRSTKTHFSTLNAFISTRNEFECELLPVELISLVLALFIESRPILGQFVAKCGVAKSYKGGLTPTGRSTVPAPSGQVQVLFLSGEGRMGQQIDRHVQRLQNAANVPVCYAEEGEQRRALTSAVYLLSLSHTTLMRCGTTESSSS